MRNKMINKYLSLLQESNYKNTYKVIIIYHPDYSVSMVALKSFNKIRSKSNQSVSFSSKKVNDDLIKQYKIRAVPTYLFFKNGKLFEKEQGIMTNENILKMVTD